MTIETRRIPRGVSAILLALALTLFAAVPAAMADTIYPDNVITGSSFDNGLVNSPPGGTGSVWSAVSNSCTLLAGLVPTTDPLTCNADTTHAAGIGAPPGSLQQAYQPPANGLDPLLFDATTVARSSAFTIGPVAAGATGTATFKFDRRADVSALIDLGSQATYTFTLVDLAGGTQQLAVETLTDADNAFQTVTAIPPPIVVPGHTYVIELSTRFSTALLTAALSKTIANFDNIRLQVADGTPTFVSAPTVVTEDATNIDVDRATFNGTINAQGTPTTYHYEFGTTAALGTSTPARSAGQAITPVSVPENVTGLAACTTYFFELVASNGQPSAAPTVARGGVRQFRTDCAPTAVTLPVTGIGPTAATFNSRINPSGRPTTYVYQYGTVASAGFASETAPLSAGDGNIDVQPNSVPVEGLTPQTAYQVRVVATNNLGTTVGNVVTFTTPGVGAQGIQGVEGIQGGQGIQGVPGAVGVNGTNGVNGAPGATGPGGPAGAKGPAGQTPTLSSSIQDLLSTNKLAMIRIDATRLKVPMSGRDIGRVRVQIFCRPIAVRTCSGNMKVRSINKINPASTGTRPLRRVTFATDAVQLDVSKIGFGILNFNAQRRAVIRRQKSIRASVIVSVIDAANNRQNVRRNVTIVAGR